MTAAEAVRELVHDGASLGIGGQTLGRVTMALAHEIIRQGVKDLTLVGCSMSMSMDMLVGAGLVRRTECGTGNLERIGTTMRWRRAIEEGRLEVEDYSHLAMASRFLAGSLGLPFMPSKSMLGTDIVNKKSSDGPKALEVVDNPWQPGDPVVLVPAVNPDVSIIHAQKADPMGNVVIEGFTTHEVEMAKASNAVIVSCEELVDSDVHQERPGQDVDTVHLRPTPSSCSRGGRIPTSTHRHYVQDEDYLARYQVAARAGGPAYDDYLRGAVYDHDTFDDYLEAEVGPARLDELRAAMRVLL